MPEDPKKDPEKNPNPTEKKYSQEDINKMMSAKAKEEREKLEAAYKANAEKQQQEFEAKIAEAKEQGEKLAKMDAKQRAEAEKKEQEAKLQERIDALDKRQKEMDARDALSSTRDELSSAGLPTLFAKYLTDVDSDKRSENIKGFKSAFEDAVNKSVDERLKGKTTPKSGNNSEDHEHTPGDITQDDWNKMTLTEKSEFWRANPNLAAKLYKNE